MPEDVMLQEAIEAIERGQRARARDLITRLLRADQNNPIYWLWMSSVVETPKEQIYCLQSVQRLDPGNASARQGMILLGALSPGDSIRPVPPLQRKWKVKLYPVQDVSGARVLLGNPIFRIVVLSLIILSAFALVGVSIINRPRPDPTQMAIKPERTRGELPTAAHTPTAVNYTPPAPTRTPTFEGNVPPLWLGLDSTYTPTPIYIATTHLTNEAYNTGMRFYEEGNLETALGLLEQAAKIEPNAPDIHYYIGEIYMKQEDFHKAFTAYENAIEDDPTFAPGHFGRARSLLAINPDNNVIKDLEKAIELDENLIEVYSMLISIHLANDDNEAALEVLHLLEDLAIEHPYTALSRARFHIAQGDYDTAQEVAEEAYKLDQTLLPTYLVLGEAALLNGNHETAIEALQTYLGFEEQNPHALTLYGQALYETEQFSKSFDVMEKALELDKELPEAYYYRGLILIDRDEGQKAVNEIVLARNLDRSSFDYSLALGRALLSANRLVDARNQITAAGRLSDGDEDMAQVYYYRALTIEAIGNQPSADLDWEELLKLPADAVPAAWRRIGKARLATPTPIPTETLTPTPKLRE